MVVVEVFFVVVQPIFVQLEHDMLLVVELEIFVILLIVTIWYKIWENIKNKLIG